MRAVLLTVICCVAAIASTQAVQIERRVLSTGATDPKALFNLVNNEDAEEIDREVLLNGKTMITYQLTYHGIPIWEGKEVVIYDPRSSLPYTISEDGYYVNSVPSIAEDIFKQELPDSSVSDKLCKDALNLDQDVQVHYDDKRWLYLNDTEHTAAIHDRVRVVRNDDPTKTYCCIVDPINKVVVRAGPERLSVVKNFLVGNVKQGYRNVSIDIQVAADGQCVLASPDNKIKIFNSGGTTNKPTDPIKFACTTPPNEVFQGELNQAIDAFDLAVQTKQCLVTTVGYDRFYDTMLEDGIMKIYTHWDNQWVNAMYNGLGIFCGDGLPDYHFPFCAAPQVVGHEVGHGVLTVLANLQYLTGQECSCLHEGFADIAGDMLSQCMYGSVSWLVRDQFQRLIGANYYNISDPSEPTAFYRNYKTSMDPHDCGNIIHRAFYLLSTTPGWDTLKAYKIFFGGMKNYWGQTPTFRSAECGILQYAKVNGLSTQELADIVNAWAGVDVTVDAQCALYGQVPNPTTTTTQAPGSLPTNYKDFTYGQNIQVKGVTGQIVGYKITKSDTDANENIWSYIYASGTSLPAVMHIKYNSPPTSFADFDDVVKPAAARGTGMISESYLTCARPGTYYILIKYLSDATVQFHSELYASNTPGLCIVVNAATTGVANTLPTLPPTVQLGASLILKGSANQVFVFKVSYQPSSTIDTIFSYIYFSTSNPSDVLPGVLRIKATSMPTSFDDYTEVYSRDPMPTGDGFYTDSYVFCAAAGDYYFMVKFSSAASLQLKIDGFQNGC